MREQFEQILLENPDDPAGYAVYADWLAEQGDPRGEFIHVQLALEDEAKTPAERKQLQQREKELLAVHEREWLGELADHVLDQEDTPDVFRNQHRFARGFLEFIRAPNLTEEFAQALVASTETWLLRDLILENLHYEPDPVDTIRKFSALGNLRTLQLGGFDEGNCHTDGEWVVDLIEKMPRLESLDLQAHNVDTDRLFALSMPHLRGLRVDHLQHYPCETLAANESLTNLTRIQFWPHALEYDAEEPYLTLDDVRAIARSPHLRSLTHLQLRLCNMGDEGCRELVDSGLLGRLKVLDLTHGEITDDGALVLAESAQLKNLERLVVTGNAIGSHGLTALRAAFPGVEADQQWRRTGNEDYQEYLYYGDME